MTRLQSFTEKKCSLDPKIQVKSVLQADAKKHKLALQAFTIWIAHDICYTRKDQGSLYQNRETCDKYCGHKTDHVCKTAVLTAPDCSPEERLKLLNAKHPRSHDMWHVTDREELSPLSFFRCSVCSTYETITSSDTRPTRTRYNRTNRQALCIPGVIELVGLLLYVSHRRLIVRNVTAVWFQLPADALRRMFLQ